MHCLLEPVNRSEVCQSLHKLSWTVWLAKETLLQNDTRWAGLSVFLLTDPGAITKLINSNGATQTYLTENSDTTNATIEGTSRSHFLSCRCSKSSHLQATLTAVDRQAQAVNNVKFMHYNLSGHATITDPTVRQPTLSHMISSNWCHAALHI